jgi:hypothetical protein
MEREIIEKYKSNYSMEVLAKEFKIGKLKIKKILQDNNIPIKSKGGQLKHEKVDQIIYSDVTIKCKCCGKEFNDLENKSGSITNHIESCFPDVIIPTSFKRRMHLKSTGNYWHLMYFDVLDKKIDPTIKCSECEWETKDITNKTGSLTKHIETNHGSIDEYLTKYPSEYHLFPSYSKLSNREELFEDENNFITCGICGEQFKTISNTHLTSHKISSFEYKQKFGNDSLVSNNTKSQFIKNLTNCVINHTYRSKSEIEIEEFIKSLNVNVNICDKKQLSGIELDLFLPDHNIAIEYNGLYWHSEKQGKHKNYHINKTIKCLEKNIHLIHIFSDEWLNKKDVIKNRIINLLNKTDNKIYARNCQIVELTGRDKSEYLNSNHLQGNDKSSIYFGLSHEGKIVSIMTFGKLRKVLGNKINNKNEYELYRYCSNNVIGGFTKLLNYFIKKYSPNKIITYANRNWSPSDDYCFYSKVGFTYVGDTKPNYSYTKKYDIREHRFNYRKDRLIKMGYDANKTENQIMTEIGFDKIWDTGNLKYEMII